MARKKKGTEKRDAKMRIIELRDQKTVKCKRKRKGGQTILNKTIKICMKVPQNSHKYERTPS